ncbi:MAG: amidohydrolase family protein, partial [Sphingomonadaceae bacterium]|nr:amidohydrolase family protein [Sphingomonadaceae bacterium]
MKKIALFAPLVLALAAPLSAQTAVTVVQAGRLLDRPGQPPRGPSTIIIKDGRISEILPGLVAGPAGARIINLSDKFVLPGLIDSHVHLD